MIRENKFHGEAFGNGIYTANNPLAFKHFGEVGLLVATLRGKIQKVSGRNGDDDANTVIGNKRGRFHGGSISYYDEIVVRQSSQCVALIQYKSHLAHDDLIWTYHVELQKLVDIFFNGEVPTELERVHPPQGIMCGVSPPFGVIPRHPRTAGFGIGISSTPSNTGLFANSSVNSINGMTPGIVGATITGNVRNIFFPHSISTGLFANSTINNINQTVPSTGGGNVAYGGDGNVFGGGIFPTSLSAGPSANYLFNNSGKVPSNRRGGPISHMGNGDMSRGGGHSNLASAGFSANSTVNNMHGMISSWREKPVANRHCGRDSGGLDPPNAFF
mmetsp:Transcript_6920/g.10143  ORF Transcript_6920/g.10143 Transcript_6920/m.10143 type:complete len:330 (+) Transcript_6920:52-1041(+)